MMYCLKDSFIQCCSLANLSLQVSFVLLVLNKTFLNLTEKIIIFPFDIPQRVEIFIIIIVSSFLIFCLPCLIKMYLRHVLQQKRSSIVTVKSMPAILFQFQIILFTIKAQCAQYGITAIILESRKAFRGHLKPIYIFPSAHNQTDLTV